VRFFSIGKWWMNTWVQPVECYWEGTPSIWRKPVPLCVFSTTNPIYFVLATSLDILGKILVTNRPSHFNSAKLMIVMMMMMMMIIIIIIKLKIKWSRYRPGVAQRVGRGIPLFFHNRGTRRGWVVSSRPRPHFTAGKDPLPILQEAGWASGTVWTVGKCRPHRDSIQDRPVHSQSLYRLNHPAHNNNNTFWKMRN